MFFPDMAQTIVHITERLYRDDISDLKLIGYTSSIQEDDGIEPVVHDVLACIDPDILALSGKNSFAETVRPHRLQ